MGEPDLERVADLIRSERETLLSRWRKEVERLPSAAGLDAPVLEDSIPTLLDELADALQSGIDVEIPEALREGSPPTHGMQRSEYGFDISEVVAEYNILRGCIHELAESRGVDLQGKPVRVLNTVLDQAIGLAVQTFATRQAMEVQRRRDEYLAFVAHDLRTPLNAIALAERILEQALQGGDRATVGRMLDSLTRNTRWLEKLVDRVLVENAHVRPKDGVAPERREFELWPLVEQLLRDLATIAQIGNTRLVNRVPEDLVVYADAVLLRQVLQNLIANALEYTPRGEVTVCARAGPEVIECEVRDDGAGIPADQLEKIFDKLQADPGRGGTGLGLAAVKTFIEAHGGTVTVASELGVGSTFRFTLPVRGV